MDAYLPGPRIQNLLVVPFTDNWEGKLYEFFVLINSAGSHGFTSCEEKLISSILTFFLSSMGSLYYQYRLNASARPLKTEGNMFCQLYNECSEDVFTLLELLDEPFVSPEEFFTHDFYCKPYLNDNFKLPYLFVVMVEDLFGRHCFGRRKMASFALAVREGYRGIRYHGWHHGFNVSLFGIPRNFC